VVAVSGTDAQSDGSAGEGELLGDPFFGRVIGGIARTLGALDTHPVLLLIETEADRANVLGLVRSGVADGALLVSTRAEDPLPRSFADAGLAAVNFARPPDDVGLSYVDVSNYDGGRLAAEHLTARAARRIAFISGPLDVPSAQDRARGFRDTLARSGQAFPPTATGNFTVESGERAMTDLLREDNDIDAVFAANDLMALGAIHALHAAGKRVPEDVAVIGFDDSAIATITRPTLTSVRQPLEEMSAQMARMLLELVREPSTRPSSVIFDPELVVRGSA